MPRIVRENDALPEWCQLKAFSIATLTKSGAHIEPAWPNERLVVTAGSVAVAHQGRSQVFGTGQFADFGQGSGAITVTPVYDTAQIVRLSGKWGTEMGGCGIFTARDTTPAPSNRGDPVSYAKSTSVDSHYHDCDEYWILLEGRATVIVNEAAAEMRDGDCLCIGMGRHHDMSHAPEPVRAVFFETSLEREKRVGHLWEHTHGPAVPAKGRD
jgi:mannose-6-phosphate isomerase-like protein (cupin superfamily)